MESLIFLSWTKIQVTSLVLLFALSRCCLMMETETFANNSEIIREEANNSEIIREEAKNKEMQCNCDLNPRPTDCDEVLKNGNKDSGVYTIWPKSRVLGCETIKVYCDMKTSGEGWTVIQRRGQYENGENLFSKGWESYKKGFGNLQKEFWLGNNNIFSLTNQAAYSVRFELWHGNGTFAYALYDHFWIDEEARKYKLHLGEYSGIAGDALGPHNEKEFYTKDQPGGNRPPHQHQGGWWSNVFPSTNLNALNRYGMVNSNSEDGITWDPFGGYRTSLRSTEIKIRAAKLE